MLFSKSYYNNSSVTLTNNTNKNCISLIKTLAAIQVMIGHLVLHLHLPFSEFARRVFSFYNGVPIFFIISGFLIWMSIGRTNTYGQYIKKRFLRIYPELWVAVAVEIVSILVLYNGWNAKDLIIFSLTQGSIFQFWTPDSLRGYGCGTPNGSLWTICVIVQFYIISWLIYKIFHKKRIVWWIMGFVVIIAISIIGQMVFENIGKEILTKLYNQTIIRYLWLFYYGCFLSEYKEKVLPVLSKFWFIFLAIALLPYIFHFDFSGGYAVIHSLMLVSGLIGFAYAFPKLSLKYDISYGIFLYHMIVCNVFISFGLTKQWIYAVIVILITILLSFISNRTIGAWSSKRKITKMSSRTQLEKNPLD